MKDIWRCKGCPWKTKSKSMCTIILEGHEDSPLDPYKCPWSGNDATFVKNKKAQ